MNNKLITIIYIVFTIFTNNTHYYFVCVGETIGVKQENYLCIK